MFAKISGNFNLTNEVKIIIPIVATSPTVVNKRPKFRTLSIAETFLYLAAFDDLITKFSSKSLIFRFQIMKYRPNRQRNQGDKVDCRQHAFGDGEDFTFGIIGATLSLFGCLFGNLLSICAFISRDPRNPSFFTVLFDVISHFDKLKSVFAAHFQLIDLLFYAIAIVAGFKVSTGVDFDKDSD